MLLPPWPVKFTLRKTLAGGTLWNQAPDLTRVTLSSTTRPEGTWAGSVANQIMPLGLAKP